MRPHDPGDQHVDDMLLAALALEDDGPETDAARAHVAGCPTCRDEVGALRETMSLVSSAGDEALVAPPPSVWAAISAELGSTPQERPEALRAVPPPAPGPVATPAPAPVAPTVDVPTGEPRATVTDLASRRRGVPTWLATTAAAVTLLAGLGGGMLIAGGDDETPQATPTVVSTAQLASLDASAQDRGSAQVRRHDDRVVLHVEAARLDGPDGIREVWLINEDGKRMVSLGLLTRGEAGDFEFPAGLLDEGYKIVDISYEPGDGDPTHSGTSLARGTLDG
ncbi:anti-sigma factor [Nocardioides solisilvae]|uniref:anti-sigma factor n=1 Tax=Nocardioides solisilvae TaxID=1542435 RepID=UPI000D745EB2|nr:anti-sigma factor [Nocardioides solisilvae]